MTSLFSLPRFADTWWRALLVAGLAGLLMVPAAAAQSYTLQEATLDGGGGRRASGGLVLTSSLAPVPVGIAATDRYVLYSAFPSPLAARAAIVIVHEPGDPAVGGEPRAITARIITNNAPLASATLVYRTGGSATATSVEMTPDDTGFVATIPGSAIGLGGLVYYFVAVDQEGARVRAPRTGVFSLPVELGGSGPATSSPQPAGNTQAAYRLLSIPVRPPSSAASPEAVLGDDIPTLAGEAAYDPAVARFFEPIGTGVSEFPRTSDFALGRAFWLIVRDGVEAIDTGPGQVRPLDRPFTVSLASGWNFVGTPFPVPVPLANLSLANQDPVRLYTYGADGYNTLDDPVTEMQPFAGYALFATSATTLTIQPPLPAEQTAATAKARAAGTTVPWRLRLRGSGPAGADADNVAAVHPDAADGWDAHDWPAPPTLGGGLQIAFDPPDGAPAGLAFSADLRRPFSRGATWPLTLRADAPGAVRLSVDGVAQVPAAFDVWLLDLATKTTWNLREAPTARVPVVGEGTTRALRLVVGTADYVREQFRGLEVLPLRFALKPPYPNPSSGPVAFQMALPEDQRVRVEVYNILGQRVAVLKDEPMTAGFHTVVWDAPRLASGLYFVRMASGSYQKTQKLVRIR
jgi:hypothetical protein